jgi:hypothetical protein
VVIELARETRVLSELAAEKKAAPITVEQITELCKTYIKTLSERIALYQKRKDRLQWLKYALLGCNYVSSLGSISGGIVSTQTAVTSQYPIYGVMIFTSVNIISTFIVSKLNPDAKMAEVSDILKRLQLLLADFQHVQITKALNRFIEAESRYDALIPSLES